MARIPWPSTAVNVSILCRRPVQREAYFWWSRRRERGEGGAGHHRAAHLSRGPGLPYPPPRYFSLPANATERRRGPTRTLCSWFERVEKWAKEDTCFSPAGAKTDQIHVLQAQILSQILSAAPESSCHTHKHARIRLTVRPKSSREVSRAFCPRRRPGRARLIPLFNLPPPPSSEY